jgi:hypothetical protein
MLVDTFRNNELAASAIPASTMRSAKRLGTTGACVAGCEPSPRVLSRSGAVGYYRADE